MEIEAGKSHLARRTKFTVSLILDISPTETYPAYTNIKLDTIKTDYGSVKIRLNYIDITTTGDPANNRLRFDKPLPVHMIPERSQVFYVPGHVHTSVDIGDFVTCFVIGKDSGVPEQVGWVCFYGEDGASLVQAQRYQIHEHVIEFPIDETVVL